MSKWTAKQLSLVENAYKKKPEWVTENQLASMLTSQLKGKSSESIRWQLRQMRLSKPLPVLGPPKILLLDIETLPLESYTWGTRKQFINPGQVIKDWSIVCWAAKFLFDKKVYGQAVTGEEAKNRKDDSILGGMWELVNEADIVITQNGDRFDMKKLNTRWLVNGFPPPMPYRSMDILKTLWSQFSFTYSKLDWVADVLGVGRKIETEFEWWAESSQGNEKYIKMMLDYNKVDVTLLEDVYMKVRPWIKNHANMNVWSITGTVCPTCGNTNLNWNGTYSTPLALYRAFRCEECGATGRSTRKEYKLASSILRN